MTQKPALKSFEHLDENHLRTMVPDGEVRAVPAKTVIVNEGDLTDAFYVVLSGRVKIYMSDDKGKEVVLNTIKSGDYFGEIVLDGGPRSASVAALEPCRLFVISHRDVYRLVEHNPAFAHDLIFRLIGRVRSLTETVRGLALKDVYGRLIEFIETEAVEENGLRIIPDRMTQHDVAARIGASREMVSRIFKDLVTGGYISTEDKKITLKKKLPPHW